MNARIPIILVWPTCEVCGCPLTGAGMCASCAEAVAEVDRVTRVLAEITEPWDWMDYARHE